MILTLTERSRDVMVEEKAEVNASVPLVQRFEVTEKVVVYYLNLITRTRLEKSEWCSDSIVQVDNEKQSVFSYDNIKNHANCNQVCRVDRGHHNLVSAICCSSHIHLISDKVTRI